MLPTITVIVPVRPGGPVGRVLETLRTVEYPAEKIEILVAEGKQPSRQRNTAAQMATGELIYFLDNDSEVTPHLFKKAMRHYDDPQVAAVGGPNLTPPTDTLLQKTFGYALGSRFAHGQMGCRYERIGGVRQASEKELILCNLSVRRHVFQQLGGFCESLYPNEENEFLNRLAHSGYKLIYDPEILIYRSRRPSIARFVKQFLGYGRGRAEQTLVERSWGNLPFFLPLALLIYLLTLPFIHPPFYLIPLAIYLSLAFSSASLRAVTKRSPFLIPGLLFVYLVMHISYAVGQMWGLANAGMRRPFVNWDPHTSVSVKVVHGANIRDTSSH